MKADIDGLWKNEGGTVLLELSEMGIEEKQQWNGILWVYGNAGVIKGELPKHPFRIVSVLPKCGIELSVVSRERLGYSTFRITGTVIGSGHASFHVFTDYVKNAAMFRLKDSVKGESDG